MGANVSSYSFLSLSIKHLESAWNAKCYGIWNELTKSMWICRGKKWPPNSWPYKRGDSFPAGMSSHVLMRLITVVGWLHVHLIVKVLMECVKSHPTLPIVSKKRKETEQKNRNRKINNNEIISFWVKLWHRTAPSCVLLFGTEGPNFIM